MKIFLLICLAAGLASTEKLDRTYLPPPGSKFSGGSPEDIQVPLEFPKETYLAGQPRPEDGIPELELGINHRPKPVSSVQSSTQKPDGLYFHNSYPKTTTSYAITQTTTFAPAEDYEGLDQSSGFFNATGPSKYPQTGGQIYQQQPNREQSDNAPSYNQYKPDNQQSGLSPYASTTHRPRFESNRKPEPYLPPVSSSQEKLGYPSRQSIIPSYQDGQQYSSTYGPVTNQPDFTLPEANQQNQFLGNANIPSSTAAPQYQDRRFGPTTRPKVNKQGFGSSVTTQQNQRPGSQNSLTSTLRPEYQDRIRITTPGSSKQNQYIQNQNFVPSTVAPHYQGEQRITSPASNLQKQYISSTISPEYQDRQNLITPGSGQQSYQQNQNNYPGNQNFPTSDGAPQYQNGQEFITPGSIQQNQYLGNQNIPSTAAPQLQNGQKFTTPGLEQSSEYSGNQNIPSTAFPQYQDIVRPGAPQEVFAPNQHAFGARVPNQQYQGIQNFPSSTATPQFADSIQFTTPGSIQQRPIAPTQQNQYQSQGNQDYSPSTVAPQYQPTTPGSVQSQYVRNQNIATTGSPQFQNGPRFSTSKTQNQYPNQQNSGLQTGNQQYPSTATPLYQSTFVPLPGSIEHGGIGINQYPGQPNYNQRFPSSTVAPQLFVTESQAQYGNGGIQSVPGSSPSSQSGIDSQGYELTSSSPSYNQDYSSTIASPFPARGYPTAVSGVVSQNKPERAQAASDRTAEIVSYENVITPEGYSYSYDTSNGIHAEETGIVGNGTKAQGGFSYTGDDGKIYSVFYSADENGFQPRGDHLPTPPPIPEAIQRVIEQANRDKESGISDDGSYNEEKYGYMKYDGNPTQLRPKNETLSSVNGEDIPNRHKNRFSEKINKQFIPKVENEANPEEDSSEDISEQVQVEEENFEDRNAEVREQSNRRIPNKLPTKVKNLTVENKETKFINRNNLNRRPVSDNDNQEDMTDDVSVNDLSENNKDSEDQYDESDVVNYKDDPNSRTDFRGTNKYLPNNMEFNKFNQYNNKRLSVLPGGAKKSAQKASNPRNPNNRKIQESQKTVFDGEQDLSIEDHIRNPSIKNKIAQKGKDQTIARPVDVLGSDQKTNLYYDGDYTEINGEYSSDDQMKSMKSDRPNKPGNYQYENKRISKPKNPEGDVDKVKRIMDDETGYEYTPPQRKFDSEVADKFSTQISVTKMPKQISQKGSQTTLRPLMSPNVYDEESVDEDMVEFDTRRKPLRPLQPSPTQDGKYTGPGKENSRYNSNGTPKTAKDGRIDSTRQLTETTPSRRPIGRPETTSMTEYEEQVTIGQNKYNTPIRIQNSRQPGSKVIYNNNVPNKEVSRVESDAFVSTTPLPHIGSNLNNQYQLPGQYQTVNMPTDSSSFYEEITPGKDSIVRRPSINNGSRIPNSQSQIPSTTYRPNYTFSDKTLAPSGSITVDGFGRPILSQIALESSENVSKNQPGSVEDKFRPGVGRFGVTSAPNKGPEMYQGSTLAPIGEDFSGPKHPQGFDPQTGYYYK